jgi:hypothetical protein
MSRFLKAKCGLGFKKGLEKRRGPSLTTCGHGKIYNFRKPDRRSALLRFGEMYETNSGFGVPGRPLMLRTLFFVLSTIRKKKHNRNIMLIWLNTSCRKVT